MVLVRNCELALSIEDPLNVDGRHPEDSTIEVKIENMKTGLRALLKVAKKLQLKKMIEDKSCTEDIKEIVKTLQDEKSKIYLSFLMKNQSFRLWDDIKNLDIIQDITQSLNDKAKEMLTEEVDYVKETKNWSFSICRICEKKDLSRNEFGDEDKSQILKMENWPYCDDRNRYLKISNIQATLRTYIMMESFPLSLYNFTVVINEILEILSVQHLNGMLLLLCFLDEPELDSIYGFLDNNINVSCGLSCLYKGVLQNKVRADLVSYERVDLSDDFSLLILDEQMLSG
ncbi:hypothetical protein CFP56_013216 [Quercus suber]|uniref:DUF629 domain-containing protein n=1 Tax=Quercus suber TaxID=58331 RepID=A0AAW0KVV6_QUESU